MENEKDNVNSSDSKQEKIEDLPVDNAQHEDVKGGAIPFPIPIYEGR